MIDHEKAALREAVEELSAILRTVSDYLEDVLVDALEKGLFKEGRTADEREAYLAWYEDRHTAVARAQEALKRAETL